MSRSEARANVTASPSALESEGIRLSIVGRVAYLDGTVPSYQEKKSISQVAAGLPNVDKVVNRLRVAPSSPRSDQSIAGNVLAALKRDPVLRLHSISVRATDGVVELTGAVSDISARIAAEAAAWSVCGVSHIVNRLEIIGEGEGAGDPTSELRRALASLLGPDASSVKIELSRGSACLRGSVCSAEEKLAVEDMVRWHPLVHGVVNQLTVQEPRSLNSLPPSA